MLSPHLHFGEISPHRIFEDVYKKESSKKSPFLRELIWRDFAFYLINHFPDYASHSFYKKFETFPWKKDSKALKKWQKGLTGYPIVDAGMRQLWHTGWMHNRARTRLVFIAFLIQLLQERNSIPKGITCVPMFQS
jgi:deoxyribodipyrimidine photo-lyase